MSLLYYWRGDNYARDLDYGAGYHLNQASPRLHEIDLGSSLWAFTRRKDGQYVLAAELVVAAKTLNPPSFRYGRYRVWGDLTRSRYFLAQGQPDITHLVRSLSVRARGDALGRAFQGHAAVRVLTLIDHQILSAYALGLPLEPRARLLPEERLEALLLAGDEAAVAALLRDEPSGLIEERIEYLRTSAPTRARKHVLELRDFYDGQCQLCKWSPRARYAQELCEAHHLRWLSRGGEDELTNLLLLCPNHHRAVHRCDAPFDWEGLSFQFGNHTEALEALHHRLAA